MQKSYLKFFSIVAVALSFCLLNSCSQSGGQASTPNNPLLGKTFVFTYNKASGAMRTLKGTSFENVFAKDGTYTSVRMIKSKNVTEPMGRYKLLSTSTSNQTMLTLTQKGGVFKKLSYNVTINFSNNTFTVDGNIDGKKGQGSGTFTAK